MDHRATAPRPGATYAPARARPAPWRAIAGGLALAIAAGSCQRGRDEGPDGPAPSAAKQAVADHLRPIPDLVADLARARRERVVLPEGEAERLPRAVVDLIARGTRALPFVRPLLESPSADTRYFAVQVMRAVAVHEDEERLIARLGDQDPDVARGAAIALGRVRDRETVPLVFRALEDGRVAQVRWGLILEPPREDDWELVPFLLGRLDDGQAASRLSAALLLNRVTGEDVAYDPSRPAGEQLDQVVRWERRYHER